MPMLAGGSGHVRTDMADNPTIAHLRDHHDSQNQPHTDSKNAPPATPCDLANAC
jgi:hypothetical protein